MAHWFQLYNTMTAWQRDFRGGSVRYLRGQAEGPAADFGADGAPCFTCPECGDTSFADSTCARCGAAMVDLSSRRWTTVVRGRWPGTRSGLTVLVRRRLRARWASARSERDALAITQVADAERGLVRIAGRIVRIDEPVADTNLAGTLEVRRTAGGLEATTELGTFAVADDTGTVQVGDDVTLGELVPTGASERLELRLGDEVELVGQVVVHPGDAESYRARENVRELWGTVGHPVRLFAAPRRGTLS